MFERLDPAVPPRRTRSRRDLAAERIQAIKRHLSWLLNARRGSSQSSPGLGLQEFNDATSNSTDLRSRICEDIRATVEAFEPRVKAVEVLPIASDDLQLQFRLQCVASLNNIEEMLEIDLTVSRQGQTTVTT
ncbi:type VI secretion system baseplate subunit TssE [Burkholderia sola]|nr:type VI secretion system baseplate subunit TssE [Burkholderia sp. AcTa6-5]